MKQISLILMLAASTLVAGAQTTTTPATTPAKTATTTAKPATAKTATADKPATTAAKTGTTATRPALHTAASKLPPGVPPVPASVATKTAFAVALRYQDIKIGDGPVAESKKMYKVHYTGWRASDGVKFDSSYDHRTPVMDKDHKPVLDADGKPKMGDAQPFSFPQGYGRLIPGWDQGVIGMRVGGKRRLFIPYQLAYGPDGRPSNDPAHPGIPPATDLIFDIELLDVTDLQMPAGHPGMGSAMPGGMPAGHPAMSGMPAGHPAMATTPTAAPAKPDAPAAPAKPAAPATPAAAPAPAAPAAPSAPAAPPSK
jgi:peptidylprolyl isomerase